VSHDNLTVRPITGSDELPLFNLLPYPLNPELAGDLAAGRRRPGWMWVALRDGHLVARAAWWARPGDGAPLLMDIFDIDGPGSQEAGSLLLRTAMSSLFPGSTRPPEYTRFLPADWHERPDARREFEDRARVLRQLGAEPLVERLRLEWRPGTPVTPPAGRLRLRPVRDAGELIGLLTLVLDGTLDAYSRDALAHMTAGEYARQQYEEEFLRYSSPHDWWRIADCQDGEPAGFVIPAHNGYNHIIAYIGVLPSLRGRGYINDILAAGTRILAAQDPPRIRAATDVGNVPMARAFARAGYAVFERQIDMIWPRPAG
jgi:RimJ/RimL family protein N-acetyltransferase